MSSVEQWREGIATNLATIEGLNVYDAEQAMPAIPAATVLVPPIVYYGEGASFGASGSLGTLHIPVMLNVSAAITPEGSRLLAEYANPVGARSIPAAIRLDPTLGGAADDAVCESFQPFGIHEYASVGYWGATFTILVLARRD